MAELWRDIRDELLAEKNREASKKAAGEYSTVSAFVKNVPKDLEGRELRLYILMRLGRRTYEEAQAALDSKELEFFKKASLRREKDGVGLGVSGNEYALLTGEHEVEDDKTKAVKKGAEDGQDKTKDNPKTASEIPPHIKRVFRGKRLADYDQAKLAVVVAKLKRLTVDEIDLLMHLATRLTDDLDVFSQALDEFFRFRDAYKDALRKQATENKDDLAQNLEDTFAGLDHEQLKKLPRGERAAKVRELVAAQRNKQLKHMLANPGETAAGMVKGLNPVDVGKGVWADVKEAADGKKGGYARWAGGVGGVGKISGWIAGIAGVLYIGLMFVPGVNLAVIGATALAAGAAAVALSAVESELRVQAATDADNEGEFKHQVNKSAEAQTNAIVGGVMMASGFAFRMIGKIKLPGRLKNVKTAVKLARATIAKKTGLTAAKNAVLDALRKARGGLPESIAKEIALHRKAAATLEKITADEFIARLAKGDKKLGELTQITPEQARTIQKVNRAPGGEGTAQRLLDQYRRAVR